MNHNSHRMIVIDSPQELRLASPVFTFSVSGRYDEPDLTGPQVPRPNSLVCLSIESREISVTEIALWEFDVV